VLWRCHLRHQWSQKLQAAAVSAAAVSAAAVSAAAVSAAAVRAAAVSAAAVSAAAVVAAAAPAPAAIAASDAAAKPPPRAVIQVGKTAVDWRHKPEVLLLYVPPLFPSLLLLQNFQ
jgi:Rieske Fe-S protein